MKASDTVMNNIADAVLKHLDLPMGQAIAIEQAEISFKAGIKEVVEWLQRPRNYSGDYFSWIVQEQEAWQSKLKELNIC